MCIVHSSNLKWPLCKNDNARFTTVFLKTVSDQVGITELVMFRILKTDHFQLCLLYIK